MTKEDQEERQYICADTRKASLTKGERGQLIWVGIAGRKILKIDYVIVCNMKTMVCRLDVDIKEVKCFLRLFFGLTDFLYLMSD